MPSSDPQEFGGENERKKAQKFAYRVYSQTEKRRESETEVASSSRKKLSFANERSWNDLECSALVEFIIITKGGQAWPFDKKLDFWESAARHIVQRTSIKMQRTGEYTSEIYT